MLVLVPILAQILVGPRQGVRLGSEVRCGVVAVAVVPVVGCAGRWYRVLYHCLYRGMVVLV